jgi:hypothetical protein
MSALLTGSLVLNGCRDEKDLRRYAVFIRDVQCPDTQMAVYSVPAHHLSDFLKTHYGFGVTADAIDATQADFLTTGKAPLIDQQGTDPDRYPYKIGIVPTHNRDGSLKNKGNNLDDKVAAVGNHLFESSREVSGGAMDVKLYEPALTFVNATDFPSQQWVQLDPKILYAKAMDRGSILPQSACYYTIASDSPLQIQRSR